MSVPLVFVWPYGLFYWAVHALAFVPESLRFSRLERAAPRPIHDRGSLRLLTALWAYCGAALALAFVAPWATLRTGRLAQFWTGLGLLAVGALLRRHCFRMLGGHFTPAVNVRPGQPIVERGAYRWVRHPSYTGGAMMFLGFGAALTNWLSLAVVAAGVAVAYTVRIRTEEQAMLAVLGEPYRSYMRRTRRLVPLVF
ncbi:MAG TPA: isoprenylcysteine carboxylmethyltransferase family protein [Candidatus Saccharimonadales bacterium]|nr:isoprenylcysteine carboxylmethyltransferase family protein [Candidatus Saccharimonadales bacterium]